MDFFHKYEEYRTLILDFYAELVYYKAKGVVDLKENICNFMPYRNDYHSIHTINLVYETKDLFFGKMVSQAVYKAHYVCEGKGVLHLPGKSIPLSPGDVFFTFPGTPFCIENVSELKYMYISFLGTRSNMITEKLGISRNAPHFTDCTELYDMWSRGLSVNHEISDLITESILLYTFYYLGERLLVPNDKQYKANDIALRIKKYIDDNYSDSTLSLDKLSKELSYSPKYISSSFKKYFKTGLSDYITILRIQHACTLIRHGFTAVADIAGQCGFSDAQYFSKTFRKRTGQTPSEYIRALKD